MTERSATLHDAISQRRSSRRFSAKAISSEALQRLSWAAQGATDESGNRTAPSADALHPLRLFASVGRVEQHSPGLFEAKGKDRGDLVCLREGDVRAELEQCAIDDQPWIGQAAAIITVCADLVAPAVEFAEQPPYGSRGRRYVYIEAGAVAQNIALQAVSEQLGCVLVAGFQDAATANVLGLKAPYMPVLHLCLGVPE